ncbi:MAG TPA: hypothetical protein VGC97_13725 [Pyrinomonadaceae bacterium]|jgi:hypothetical protein
MSKSDFIPQNPARFVVWFTNFILHLKVLSAKYGICSESIDALIKDHEWVYLWTETRADADEEEKFLSGFYNSMVAGDARSNWITAPHATLPDAPDLMPETVLPHIKDRIREVAECIKSQSGVYTKDDGARLGVLTRSEAGWTEEDYAPDLKFNRLRDFSLEVDFRKFGLDAVKFEYRFLGGEWQFAGFLWKSPDVLKIPPPASASPEHIEIRAVFWDDNRNFGDWSPVYRMVIIP